MLGQLKTGKWLATKFENVPHKITRTEFGNTNGQPTCVPSGPLVIPHDQKLLLFIV